METKHSRWLQGVLRKEGEKVDFGTATELANIQTKGRTCKGMLLKEAATFVSFVDVILSNEATRHTRLPI